LVLRAPFAGASPASAVETIESPDTSMRPIEPEPKKGLPGEIPFVDTTTMWLAEPGVGG
jgi:hypothetical protein